MYAAIRQHSNKKPVGSNAQRRMVMESTPATSCEVWSFPLFFAYQRPELCSRILGLLSLDPVLKELLRRNEAERRMTTTAVVKHFDIFEQIGLRVLMRLIARGVNPFVLQAIEEAFRRGIVPTITLATHRAIVDWIEGHYHRERLHTSIGFRTPVHYKAAMIAA